MLYFISVDLTDYRKCLPSKSILLAYCLVFKDLVTFVHQQAAKLDEQSVTMEEQAIRIEEQTDTIEKQTRLIEQLRQDNKVK